MCVGFGSSRVSSLWQSLRGQELKECEKLREEMSHKGGKAVCWTINIYTMKRRNLCMYKRVFGRGFSHIPRVLLGPAGNDRCRVASRKLNHQGTYSSSKAS